MITLYGKVASRASRNLWALEELGVPYKHVPIDNAKGETRTPEYLAINAAGKIPSMTDDGGVAMIESLAINLYLARTYGAGKLWPADAAGRAKCLQWTLWAATELEPPAVGRLIEMVLKKESDRDPKVVEALAVRTKPVLDVLNSALNRSPHLVGSAFTIADLNAACVADYFLRTKFDLAPWPAVAKWLTACLERPANKKILAMRAAAMKQ